MTSPRLFTHVESIGRSLPNVEVSTTWGQPSLKVHGKMFVGLASPTAAEPHSLVVMMDLHERDALLRDEPGAYYTTQQYADYPCVLARLARIDGEALRDLVTAAYRFIGARGKARRRQAGAAVRPARRAP